MKVDPDRVWQATLRGLTDSDIKNGFRALSDSGAEWPPSAPEFRKMCIDNGDSWEHKGAAYKEFETKLIDNKTHDREIALEHIRKIKESVQMKQTILKG